MTALGTARVIFTDASLRRLHPSELRIVELDVLRGDNARGVAKACATTALVLVGAWAPIGDSDLAALRSARVRALARTRRLECRCALNDLDTRERSFDTCTCTSQDTTPSNSCWSTCLRAHVSARAGRIALAQFAASTRGPWSAPVL
ncbi:MAG: hypothetical protein JNN27_20725 [Planctomycetes bacterium]|nr:hypothetical protein [Planctomycetota bacterium]